MFAVINAISDNFANYLDNRANRCIIYIDRTFDSSEDDVRISTSKSIHSSKRNGSLRPRRGGESPRRLANYYRRCAMSFERTITKIRLAMPTRAQVTEREIAIAAAKRRVALRGLAKLKAKGVSNGSSKGNSNKSR